MKIKKGEKLFAPVAGFYKYQANNDLPDTLYLPQHHLDRVNFSVAVRFNQIA